VIGRVAQHVGGVSFPSLRQRENFVRAMRDGEKRALQGGDVA
jgi:cytochrome b